MFDYYISTDKNLLDANKTWHMLKDCFWSKNIPIEYIEKLFRFSLCFGVYLKNNKTQIGFGRVITDYTTYAYVCDVIVEKNYRKKGIGTSLIKKIVHHPNLENLKTWSLVATGNSIKIYRELGFKKINDPSIHLEINNLEIYTQPVSYYVQTSL